MIRIRIGKVIKVLSERDGLQELEVSAGGEREKALVYTRLTGKASPGMTVVLNTTAVDLGLGTGGYHFVMAIPEAGPRDPEPGGHVMKVRYTPSQVKVRSVEEDPTHRAAVEGFTSLGGMPVVVAELHSMVPAVAAGVRAVQYEVPHRAALDQGVSRGCAWADAPQLGVAGDTGLTVAYVMTDLGALPAPFSRLVGEMKRAGLVDSVITVGHAFGGDLEAVNVYTGLIAAREIVKADVSIVAMGPGILGTGTKYGFSGIEQGYILDAAADLGGCPVFVPRISFADLRERHWGVSHHSLTILERVCHVRVACCLPRLADEDKMALLRGQLAPAIAVRGHRLVEVDADAGLAALRSSGVKVATMGRGVDQEKEFFLAACAAGMYAGRLVGKGSRA